MPIPTSRRQLLGLTALGLPALSSLRGRSPGPARFATVILVRHAEAAKEGPDPALVERGRERAERLALLLASAGVSRLWATELARTQQTLQPLARELGLEIERYAAREPHEFARDQLRRLPDGAVALVAGHSNTVPTLVTDLGGHLEGLDGRGFLDEGEHDRVVLLPLHAAADEQPLSALTTLDLRLTL